MFDNLEIEQQPVIIHCKICSKEEWIDDFSPTSETVQIMAQHHICHECALWKNIIDRPKPTDIIAAGRYYTVHPYVKRPYNKIMGSLGKEFYFLTNKFKLIKSNNVCCHGVIPARFRDQLPDNAFQLPLPIYMRIKRDLFQCNSKGCWDRYHCLRYNLECEKDGPFNTIPDKHQPGDEHCPSFININTIQQ